MAIEADYTRQYAVLVVFRPGTTENSVKGLMSGLKSRNPNIVSVEVKGFDERLMSPVLYFP